MFAYIQSKEPSGTTFEVTQAAVFVALHDLKDQITLKSRGPIPMYDKTPDGI